MPKLIWVALPLLLTLTGLALWLLLRRRLPARRSVHMVGSALLMVYLLATAGLGIFWVANQQLPVFDWHYLLGYATLALVALHLWFNLPLLWRWWRRLPRARRSAMAASVAAVPSNAATATPASRRPLLLALGVAAASALAFAFGRRIGRHEAVDAAAAAPDRSPPAASNRAAPAVIDAGMSFVERFHAASSTARAGVLLRLPGVDWGHAPPPFKTYAGDVRALPSPRQGAASAGADVAAIGALLWHTAGISARRGGLALRTSPSSGALFSTELYLAVRTLAGLEPGWWHYDPQRHALNRAAAPQATVDDAALGATAEARLRDAPLAIVATAVWRRTGHKYRDRSYRYLLADLGHALENLRVAGDALGWRAELLPAFDDSPVSAALGLDADEEGVLAVIALHGRAARAATAMAERVDAAGHDARPATASPPSGWRAPPGDAVQPALGITGAMHRASSLRQIAAARASDQPVAATPPLPRASPRTAPAEAAASMPSQAALASSGDAALPLPPALAAPSPRPVLDLIAMRRSQRRYAATALPLPSLSALLRALHAGGQELLSAAVRIRLVAHAVADLAPGAYRYDAQSHSLRPRGPRTDLRQRSRAAALDQDVIGDAAVAFVLSVDRATIAADALGAPRGYRHALLEAGLFGERIYLEATARGLGVCAVGAFYDDEAAALVGIDPAREWVVHFTAVGVSS